MDTFCVRPDIDLIRYALNVAYRIAAHLLAEYIISVKQESLRPGHKQADVCFLAHFVNKFRKRSFSLPVFNTPPVRLSIVRYEQYIKSATPCFL